MFTERVQCSGTMLFLVVVGVLFGWLALYPWVPALANLTKEDALIQKVWKENFPTTTTRLITQSGLAVECVHSKTGGCLPNAMKALQAQNASVIVWHDGERVYQLSSRGLLLMPYNDGHGARWFAGSIALLAFLGALILLGINKGIVGTGTVDYTDQVKQ